MGRGLIYTGLILLVLAVVFSTAIFPGMVKMPADYEQEYTFEGSIQVFVNPPGILFPIDIEMTRLLEAESVTDDDVLLLRQDITFYDADSGLPLATANPPLAAQVDSSELYGLDRTERTNVSAAGVASRSGQFTFPGDTQQETYKYWSSSTNSAVNANFVREETYQDLDVYVFEINVTDHSIAADATTGLPRTMDVYALIRVEPVSGIPVYASTMTTIKLQHPLAGPMPVFISENHFTQATIDDLSETAESARTLILWASVYGFWGLVGLAIILIALGFFRATRS